MSIERRSPSRFDFYQRVRMRWCIESSMFYEKSRRRDPCFHPLSKEMNDETLLTYYAAARISPDSNDKSCGDVEEISSLVSYHLINAVFNSGGPDFEPKKRKDIIQRALYIARSNWMAVKSDSTKSLLRRVYALHVIADMDRRLEAMESTEHSKALL